MVRSGQVGKVAKRRYIVVSTLPTGVLAMRWVGKVGSDSSAFDSNARSRLHVDRYLVYDKLHQDSGIRIDICGELYIYFLLRINCT